MRMPRISMIAAIAMIAASLFAAACDSRGTRQLDPDRIVVSTDARLRTDTVGEPPFVDQATFVLVDADNHADEGAYVTLTGELADAAGAQVATLKPQSLWMPAGERRTFALVDAEHQPRPTAAAAKIHVRGVLVTGAPPSAHIEAVRELADNGKIVVQGTLVSDADRPGRIMVIGAFHDRDNRPMTRPFSVIHVEPHARTPIQFAGPNGSIHGTLFVGESVF